jgi:hypothetical protein
MANSDYKVTTTRAADFTPIAKIVGAVDYLDHVIALGAANFGNMSELKKDMYCLCDEEFMQLIKANPDGTVQVKRGCADTVPSRHGHDSIIWFFRMDHVGFDAIEHSAGEANSIKYAPYTLGGGALPVAASEIDVVQYNWRFDRPYAPGRLKINTDRWYISHTLSADAPKLTFTWAHRNRKTQADKLLDHDANSLVPETGTQYTFRVYNQSGTLMKEYVLDKVWRTNKGAPIDGRWEYTWAQAMLDFGYAHPPPTGGTLDGTITLHSTRGGLDSWQGYSVPFQLHVEGKFIKVANLGHQLVQNRNATEDATEAGPVHGLMAGQLGVQTAQVVIDHGTDPNDVPVVAVDGMYVAAIQQGAAQSTSFYGSISRNLFEAPYAYLLQLGVLDVETRHLITVAAKPSDRLTDGHSIWTRFNYPAGSGDTLPYLKRIEPLFSPWATLADKISYFDDVIQIDRTSFIDGIPLSDVQPGQIAQVDAEMVRVEEVAGGTVTLARGCFDTIPAPHNKGSRIWFYGAESGYDPTAYPLAMDGKKQGSAIQVKMVPISYGSPVNLRDVPTDSLVMRQRTLRPYPPGQVQVDGRPWWRGKVMVKNENIVITWVHRNRIVQADAVIDHFAAGTYPETGQTYRLKISVMVYPEEGDPHEVLIREAFVDGLEFTYTWAMAETDGYRAARLVDTCGTVTVGMTLYAMRDGLESWQGYVIPLSLPAAKCPPGRNPGGGQLPATPGYGNGDTGHGTPGGSTPGDDIGDGPDDPFDNNDDIDDGDGPPDPPEVPPEWPDPVEPPPTPDPGDPNTALAGHWDLNWDRHWDAYNKDNQGD